MKPGILLVNLIKKIPTIQAKYTNETEIGINPAYCDIEHSVPLCPHEKKIWLLRGDLILAVGNKNAYVEAGNTTILDAVDTSVQQYIDLNDRYGHPSLAMPEKDYDGSVYSAGWLYQHANHIEVFLYSGRYHNEKITKLQQHYLERYISMQFMEAYGEQDIIFFDYEEDQEIKPFLKGTSFPAEKVKRTYSPASIKNKNLLDLAIEHNDDSVAIQLFEAGAKVSPAIFGKSHAIHLVAKNGLLNHVQALLERDHELIHARDHYNQTPLLWAASRGHNEVVNYLIAQGADINLATQLPADHESKVESNRSPLDWAIIKGHATTTSILIKAGAVANYMSSVTNTESHLTIFTEVSWGTLGDYYAALRLIRLLKLENPSLSIHWIIKGVAKEVPDELENSDTILIHKIDDWSVIFSQPELIINIRTTPAILVYPTFHFLTKNHIEKLEVQFNKPFISCLEYSYRTSKKSSNIELQTGLGNDEMGIFIDSADEKQHPLTQIDKKQPIIEVLFSKYKNNDTSMQSAELEHSSQKTDDLTHKDSLTEDLISNIDEALAQQYDEKHMLFFGYANKKLRRVVNAGANVSNFIRISLSIADDNKIKDIDIIASISMEQFIALGLSYSAYNQVTFVSRENDIIQNKVIYQNPLLPHLPQLRIINLFRFDNNTFQKLVAASHPFKLCTGDQSLSDVVSTENAIVFYQIMDWKAGLANNYLLIAKTALRAANLDPDQSIVINYLKILNNLQTLNLSQMKEMVTNPQLLLESKLIHQYIIEHKNLSVTLPKYILGFLRHLKPDIDQAFLNQIDENGYTLLHYAALLGQIKMVRYLIDNGADVNISTVAATGEHKDIKYPEMTALDIVVDKQSHVDLAILLFEAGANVSPAENGKSHLIHVVAKNGLLNHIQTLIERDPELVHVKDGLNQTPLLWAASRGHHEVVAFLITKGADVNLATEHAEDHKNPDSHHNYSPLDWAIKGGHAQTILILVNAGAIANPQHTMTALIALIKAGNLNHMQLLIDHNPSLINATNKDGYTLLHQAAHHGQLNIVNALIKAGADVNASSPSGSTALMFAAANNHHCIIKTLLSKGAKNPFVGTDGEELALRKFEKIDNLTLWTLTEKKQYEFNPHRHVKIWLSKDPLVFMNEQNQLRLVQMRSACPSDEINLIYDSQLLSEKAHHALLAFCPKHDIKAVDVRKIILQCDQDSERQLIKIYEDEISHLDAGGNLAAASDILRWLEPVFRLGTYSDFDVKVSTKALPKTILVFGEMLFNIGSVLESDVFQSESVYVCATTVHYR